jgi:hypothetical protein
VQTPSDSSFLGPLFRQSHLDHANKFVGLNGTIEAFHPQLSSWLRLDTIFKRKVRTLA